ncbi:rhodanese-like domain-containing protein [Geomonas sp. Red69]|uniref:Rhodanese-like domain-containing protein n=1 Tax=Geomonas diazotrophica TaxID=2843197 RepID=A0ABX8JGA0_9BACT|nr:MULTISPECIES: rhodanese-like domain-containing protein [Geomonas]MBU5638447.1 rhodanese-like domain-containing protein [Geomonas diazotrophica]QWV97353.1 rhodanese-like domain-containing protein [Geomonas nitrogeniifigens]QXE86511.1 rhodanese-like domain-containing protein [Geomonas nitrogeniifigens]
MRRVVSLTLAVLFTLTATAAFAGNLFGGNYRYVAPADFKKWLETGKKVQIVDIQVPAEFQQHHFKGAVQTNAFPVKSAEDKQKLDRVLPQLTASREEIVIVCPRGGGGAKNTYDYLKGKGIAEARLLILEEGMQGWPYRELVAQGK